jgi:hypothetical protein
MLLIGRVRKRFSLGSAASVSLQALSSILTGEKLG